MATLLVPNAYHVGRYPRLAFGRRLRGKRLLGLRERAKCVSQFHVSNQVEKLRVHMTFPSSKSAHHHQLTWKPPVEGTSAALCPRRGCTFDPKVPGMIQSYANIQMMALQ